MRIEGRGGHGGGGHQRTFLRSRRCPFCGNKDLKIDYKHRQMLGQFVTERYKIVPRRISNVCASHQRELTREIKRARHIGILAYSSAQN